MKKGLVYFLGVITGMLLMLVISFIIYFATNENTNGDESRLFTDGVTNFLDEPIPFTEAKNFQVWKVVYSNGALAHSRVKKGGDYYYTNPLVLFISDKENSLYDGQIIEAPNGSKVFQIGTYKYQTQKGVNTVPIVRFIK